MHDFFYFNGDSYSASQPDGCWVDSFTKNLNVNHLNEAQAGASNSRIFRSCIETLIKIKNEYKNPIAIIGLSFVSRDEIWDPTLNQLVTLDKLLNDNKISEELKLKLHFLDINHQMVHFYTNLYMFVNLLEKWEINYFIFSAADNSDFGTLNWDHLKQFHIYKAITNNPKIYQLHNFFVKKWAQENNIATKITGHLKDQIGYQKFANFISSNLQIR